jgi:hypothetical protein
MVGLVGGWIDLCNIQNEASEEHFMMLHVFPKLFYYFHLFFLLHFLGWWY